VRSSEVKYQPNRVKKTVRLSEEMVFFFFFISGSILI